MSPTGNSVIDYFIVSDTLLNCTNKMSVLTRTESFHFPISLTLNLKDVQCVQNQTEHQSNIKKEYEFLKWDNEKLDQFIQECLNNNFRSYLQCLEYDLCKNVDTCISLFCDFFMNASIMMRKKKIDNKSLNQNTYSSKTFFDKECYEQKLMLRKCLRKYKSNNNDENKIEYTECRKKYKSFLKNKKKIFNNSKISSFLNNFNNSKMFWKEIKSITLKENNCNNISTGQFFIYFKSVFQKNFTPPPICFELNQTAYFTFNDQNESFLALNSDITIDEVKK